MTSRSALALASCLILMGTAVAREMQDGESDQPAAISSEDVTSDEDRAWGQVVTDSDAAAALSADDYELNAAAIAGDTLVAAVSYGGGCEEHHFALDASADFRESYPVQLVVTLAHDANNDTCERWVIQEYLFDLAPLRARYHEEYGQDAGVIVVQLEGAEGELVYEFFPVGTAVEGASWARVKDRIRE